MLFSIECEQLILAQFAVEIDCGTSWISTSPNCVVITMSFGAYHVHDFEFPQQSDQEELSTGGGYRDFVLAVVDAAGAVADGNDCTLLA